MRFVKILLLLLIVDNAAFAQCVLSGADISNLDNSACSGRMLSYTESTVGNGLIPLGYPVPMPASSLTEIDGFRTYDSLLAGQQDLALTNDNVAAMLAGSTLNGRDIWAYALGDADSTTVDGLAEPAVMAIGGIHAREWQTPEAVSSLIERIAAANDDAWLGSFFRDNLNVVLIPVLNVDGFLQTQAHPDRVSADPGQPREGRMRRRNLRNPNTNQSIDNSIDTTDDNFWGVDLNRNSPQGWGMNAGSSASVTSLIYRGATESSEPEIVALQNAATFGPENRLRLYMDIHSFSQIYLAPSTGNARRDAYSSELAAVMRAVQNNKYAYAADGDNGGIGVTADFFGYTYEIPAWTLETEPLNGAQQYGGTASHGHSGFILPDAEVARMRGEIAESSLIGFYRQVGPPYVAALRIRDINSGELKYSASWSMGAQRNLSVDVNNALVPGGNYRLWASFSKPMRYIDQAGQAGTYPGQNTTPTSGSVSVELPNMDVSNDIAFDMSNVQWLDQPDSQIDGYSRYVFDAATIDFVIPASLVVATSEPAIVSLSFADMSDFQLDANPATPVDWQNGGWSNYENEDEIAADVGGIDCQFKPFIAMDVSAAAPTDDVNCRAFSAAPPPPPPTPPPPPPAPTSSGGGTAGVLLLVGLFILASACHRRGLSQSSTMI